ncbi:unnamed protein product [Mytilus edulis]|uniref:Uncharacterized protein n=1 Tax=Mytilus edulis TaxID=6550 RepID=A0A8S3T3D5_MYTED|nr:unnamed protein product [Mytilus edulis]
MMSISEINANQSVSILLDHQYLGPSNEIPPPQRSCSTTSVSSQINVSGKKQEADANGLDAGSIQQCFQNMINLTALSDLDSSGSSGESKVVQFELRLASDDSNSGQITTAKLVPVSNMVVSRSDVASPEKNLKQEILIQEPKKEGQCEKQTKDESPSPDEVSKSVNDNETKQKEWKKFNRDFQEEVRYNALLQHTMSLLVKRWAEYLSFSPEQMYKFELENGIKSDLTDEVLEMLQDKDRHIWQIIETIGEK